MTRLGSGAWESMDDKLKAELLARPKKNKQDLAPLNEGSTARSTWISTDMSRLSGGLSRQRTILHRRIHFTHVGNGPSARDIGNLLSLVVRLSVSYAFR